MWPSKLGLGTRFIGLWVCLAPGACAGAVGWHTDQKFVAAGQDVVVRYKNASIYKVWGNLCLTWFEHFCENTGTWRAVEKLDDQKMCLLILRPISAREFSVPVRVDQEMPAGTYRIVTEVEVGGHRRRLETNPFVVSGGGEGTGLAPDVSCDTAAQPGADDRPRTAPR